MAELTLFKVDKHGRSMYRVNGNKNTTTRFGASFFKAAPPQTIAIESEDMATVSGPKAKLSKEERAALPKPTPAEKLAQAKQRQERQAQRVARLEAALAASEAGAGAGEAAGEEQAVEQM